MSDGTVAFRAGSRDYGVAMKGLKHLSTGFYVAASMDEPGDSIRMTYLGSLGNFSNVLFISNFLVKFITISFFMQSLFSTDIVYMIHRKKMQQKKFFPKILSDNLDT